ncbi:MAG TPA: lysyl oxidase family protein [Kineosporiaceae bacterium]|nr:lysyl oxidase family protein [Kineosporiaceae bacterium]
MNRSHRAALKRLAPATALVVAAGLSAAGFAADSVAADSPSPALHLVSSTDQQDVLRGKKEPVYLYDLGVYTIAEKAAFEIRTLRGKSYRDPIQATLSLGEGASKTTTSLPSELFTSVDHLTKFFSYTVTNKAGKKVKSGTTDFCPSSYDAARAVPDGAATSPYPQGCGSHPFAKGSVLGIQRGWSTPALGNWENPISFKGADGLYTLRVTILAPWQKALGLTADQSDVTTKLNVKTYVEGDKGAVATTSAGHHDMAGMAGMHDSAATTGTLSPQHAKMELARQKSLGKAAVPHTAAPTKTLRAADVAGVAGPMPDLQSLPAYGIELSRSKSKKTYLNFGATVWNAGPSPLVVDGFRIKGTKEMTAYQYFYDNAGNEVGSAPAGGLQWDPRPGHTHWHFKAFATYRLLDSTKKFTKRSGKEAFCLAPTDPVNLNADGANFQPASTDLSTACGSEGALSIREVLDAGWGDTYAQYRPGQSFNVTNLAKGIYYIEVLANPDQKLVESNPDNNSALRKVRIGGKVGGKRTIKVYDYQGIKAP